MTLRYLLLAGGDPSRRAQIAQVIGTGDRLRTVQWGSRMTVITSRLETPTDPGAPLIIGDLYSRSRTPPDTSPWPGTPEALVRDRWGRYVAAWSDDAGGARILRDPSGALPTYYRSVGDLTLIASDLDLLSRAEPLDRRLNWPEIARILGAGDLRSDATGLAAVSELPAGSQLTIDERGARVTPLWLPASFVLGAATQTFEQHAADLRATIDQVIGSLAHSYPNVLATTSGGLDSSIVALALAPVARRLTCLTAATDQPSGDERRYARLVAEAAAADYLEAFYERADVDLLRSHARHLPRPTGRPFMQSLGALIAAAATRAGADAVFNGSGGDNVFCFLQSATPVADRVRVEGWLRALPTIRDVAAMSHASYREVIAATWRRLAPDRRHYRWRRDETFLDARSRELEASFAHPWLDLPPGTRLGSAVHIAMILRTQNYLDPWRTGDAFDVINPLLAQPIVEQCLAIPSWIWCSGGANRAVARRAFADRLPPTIQSRVWKGGPEAFLGRLVEDHRPLIRSQLFDGELASHGVLDRGAVAAALDDPRPLPSSHALRLLNLCDAEAWVRAMA